MSKHSATIDEFYATTPRTAKWVMNVLRTIYGLEGKTAFEPAVGAFVFPDAGPELDWTTNDLNKWTDREPDTLSDFLESDFDHYDFIITNPPFGRGNKLAFNFAKKACQHADVVAMVVPFVMGEWSKRLDNAIPRDMKMAYSKDCPEQWFDLPDGTRRHVRTRLVVFERKEGYTRPKFVEPPKDTRELFVQWDDEGEFCVRTFGDGIGDLRTWSEDLGGTFIRFNVVKGNKKCAVLKLIMSVPWRVLYGERGQGRAPWYTGAPSVPRTSQNAISHWVNCMGVLEGRADAHPEIDYEAFMESVVENATRGLTVPQVHV